VSVIENETSISTRDFTAVVESNFAFNIAQHNRKDSGAGMKQTFGGK